MIKQPVFDSDKEKSLDVFLKNNNPAPPSPSHGEGERILQNVINATPSSLGNKAACRKTTPFASILFLRWLVPVAATAAIGFLVINHNFSSIDNKVTSVSDDNLSAYLEETLTGMYEDSYFDQGEDNVASLSTQYYQIPDQINGEGY
ncbi:MAG: hypothetical protein ACD_62C00607G0013 [uncultured bacterium]|nr:MAG: hypothetical protein ACD_62C00607G0013 [uncultured bacterium]HLD44488.1 hypothetical protein [bacterium]